MRVFSLLVLLGFLVFVGSTAQAQPDSLAPAKACFPRAGLPNFFGKLSRSKPVTIVYFGGSITEAAGGWRDQSTAWLRKQYPNAKIESVNAAIGGTGSDLGVFRLGQQVLSHKPDLVFVEFAVNDNGKPADVVGRSMEGIVRQIRKANSRTDICFVYTMTGAMYPLLAKGQFPLSATTMERVADHYGIPSVHLGLDVVRMAKAGELVFQGKPEEYPGKLVFSADNVHPYPQTGHRLYAKALAEAMPVIQVVKARSVKPRRLLYANNWEQAKMIDARQLQRSDGWQEITPGTDSVADKLKNRFGYLLKATKPGEKLIVRFRGTKIGLYDVMGPGCGQYIVTVDGQHARMYPRFDEFCTYYRSNYFLLPDLPDGEHTVELTVAADALDKAAILQKRKQVMASPRPYQAQDCYIGQLLLIGELLE